jgi:hypothetical protein
MLSNCQIVISNLPYRQLHTTTASFLTFQIDYILRAPKSALQTVPQKIKLLDAQCLKFIP